MPMSFDFIPPKVNAVARLAAAVEVAVEMGGKVLLEASQELVPVGPSTKGHKGGTLKDSGKVEPDGPRTIAVSYEAYSPQGYPYGIRIHEDGELNHPNGGESHFLQKPMHSKATEILEAMATALRTGM